MLEAHVHLDGISFIISTKILDLSAGKYINERSDYINAGFTEAQTNEKPTKLAALKSLISRLSGRQDEDIPSGKGLCIPNGFIRDDGYKHKEQVTFTYENDDFLFKLFMDNTETASDDTLFNRSGAINEALRLSGEWHTISKKALSPGGIPAQEWLFGGKHNMDNPITGEEEEVAAYHFILYANEAVASPTRPWLSVGLNNDYKNSAYDQTKMIEIWDRLVGTLRYRPGAF
jgi:hypothetical protein